MRTFSIRTITAIALSIVFGLTLASGPAHAGALKSSIVAFGVASVANYLLMYSMDSENETWSQGEKIAGSASVGLIFAGLTAAKYMHRTPRFEPRSLVNIKNGKVSLKVPESRIRMVFKPMRPTLHVSLLTIAK